MNAAVELRNRRLIIVRTLVLDVLPLSKMLTLVPLKHFYSGRLMCTNYLYAVT